MVNRITSSTRYDMLINDMKINEYNFNKLTAQLSSGNKIMNITDDPIVSVNVLNTNRQLGQIKTFEQNVGMASAELSALDDLLSLASSFPTENFSYFSYSFATFSNFASFIFSGSTFFI